MLLGGPLCEDIMQRTRESNKSTKKSKTTTVNANGEESAWVAGTFCNGEGFPGEAGAVDVLQRGKRGSQHLFSCSHYAGGPSSNNSISPPQ